MVNFDRFRSTKSTYRLHRTGDPVKPEAHKLTKRLIDSTPCPDTGQTFLRDSELRGFALRLTPRRKMFIVEKRLNKRLFRVVLGAYGVFTIDQARKQAQAILRDLHAGIDPVQAKRQKREELTLGQLFTIYLERRAAHKRTINEDKRRYRRFLVTWQSRKLSAVTRADVAKLHATIGTTVPYEANRVLALIRTLFKLAKAWGLWNQENPATNIDRFPETKRDRFLQPLELPKFLEALQHESVYVRAAFLTMLLTGAREQEVLSMQWSDVDLQQAIWRIPLTKSGKPHMVALPTPVVEILQALPRQLNNPYVFPGKSSSGRMTSPWAAWGRICKRMGVDDLRVHDLRRTLGSWMAASGASLPLIGKALNHANPQTTAIYARLQLDPVREVLEANAKKMLSFAPPVHGSSS